MRRRVLKETEPDPTPKAAPKTRRSNGSGGLRKDPASGYWIARYSDHSGKRCQRSTGTGSRQVAERFLAKRIEEVALRAGGLVTDAMVDTKDRAQQPVAKLVDDYAAYLADTASPKHAGEQLRRVREINLTAKINRWADVTADRVEGTLRTMADASGWKPSTRNAWLTAYRGWTRWLVQRRRVDRDPTDTIPKAKSVRTDYRRSLTGEEAARLVQAAEGGETMTGRTRRGRFHFERTGEELEGEVKWSMTGEERAALYATGLDCGQRLSALRRLTVADLDFDAATVRIKAVVNSKSRETLVLPLRDATVTRLRGHVAGKHPKAPVFALPPAEKTAEVFRRDLAVARAKWVAEAPTPEDRLKRGDSGFLAETDEDDRRLDFHSLRVSCASLLAEAGASVTTIAKVTGHSTATQTLQRHYLKSDAAGLRAAVDSLPELKMTGTDADQPWPQGSPKGSPIAVRSGDGQCGPVGSVAGTAERSGMQNVLPTKGKTALTRGQDGSSSEWAILDSNQGRHSQLIYSQPRLAAPAITLGRGE